MSSSGLGQGTCEIISKIDSLQLPRAPGSSISASPALPPGVSPHGKLMPGWRGDSQVLCGCKQPGSLIRQPEAWESSCRAGRGEGGGRGQAWGRGGPWQPCCAPGPSCGRSPVSHKSGLASAASVPSQLASCWRQGFAELSITLRQGLGSTAAILPAYPSPHHGLPGRRIGA